MDWVQILNSVGFPVTLCGALLYAFYRIGIFLAPLIKDFVAAQMELIESLKTTTARQTGILETNTQQLADHGERLRQIHEKVIGKQA